MDADRAELLRQSNEQYKAKTAVDVVRLLNPSDGKVEFHLYFLAVEYLIGYFGGVPVNDNEKYE